MTIFHAVLALVVAQRLAELAIARRNTRRLLAQGGVEAGRGHYPLLVGLHLSWLVAMAATIPADRPPRWDALAVLGLLLGLRLWVMTSLGRFWTTRIITLPGAPLVHHGPYRWMRHPNYLVVAGEMAVLPLAFDAFPLAMVFSALNAVLLRHRIRVEDQVLSVRGSSASTG